MTKFFVETEFSALYKCDSSLVVINHSNNRAQLGEICRKNLIRKDAVVLLGEKKTRIILDDCFGRECMEGVKKIEMRKRGEKREEN